MSAPLLVFPLATVERTAGYFFTSNFVWYVYDWMLSLSEEVDLVTKRGLTWSIAIYFLSRASELGQLLVAASMTISPVDNCQFSFAAVQACSVIALASTSFLFLLRVRAVYGKSTRISAIFGALWFLSTAVNIYANARGSLGSSRIPLHSYCEEKHLQYNTWPSTSSFVFDTLVFLAISYQLVVDAAIECHWRSWILPVVKGKGFLGLSRSLLRSGQLYYLAALLLFIANLAWVTTPLINIPPQHYTVNIYTGFTNIIACRVFRGISLGHLENNPTQVGLTSTKINAAFELVPTP